MFSVILCAVVCVCVWSFVRDTLLQADWFDTDADFREPEPWEPALFQVGHVDATVEAHVRVQQHVSVEKVSYRGKFAFAWDIDSDFVETATQRAEFVGYVRPQQVVVEGVGYASDAEVAKAKNVDLPAYVRRELELVAG